MAKFKVGDKVIGNKMADEHYNYTRCGWSGYVLEVREPFIVVSKCENGRNKYSVVADCFDLVTEHSKIVITHDGKTTLARHYVNNKVVGRAEAKCSPKDVFDFKVGAELAFERLMGGKTVKAEETAKPVCWSGKVVCTHNEDPDSDFVVGGIYKCVDGKLIDRNGCERPACNKGLALSDFAPGGFCDSWYYRFLPIVEENA